MSCAPPPSYIWCSAGSRLLLKRLLLQISQAIFFPATPVVMFRGQSTAAANATANAALGRRPACWRERQSSKRRRGRPSSSQGLNTGWLSTLLMGTTRFPLLTSSPEATWSGAAIMCSAADTWDCPVNYYKAESKWSSSVLKAAQLRLVHWG